METTLNRSRKLKGWGDGEKSSLAKRPEKKKKISRSVPKELFLLLENERLVIVYKLLTVTLSLRHTLRYCTIWDNAAAAASHGVQDTSAIDRSTVVLCTISMNECIHSIPAWLQQQRERSVSNQ